MPPTTRSAAAAAGTSKVADTVATDTTVAPAAKRRKVTPAVKYLCTSCDQERLARYFPDVNPTPECDHLINTCKACLKEWVEYNVEAGNFVNVGDDNKAPGVRCPECNDGVMRDVNVENAAPKSVYKLYQQRKRTYVANNTPGWRWCMAPHCDAGQVHVSPETIDKGAQPKKEKESFNFVIYTCIECGAKACVPCDRPYHEGETCEQYQHRVKDRLEEEQRTLREISRVAKSCPKCKKKIQKNGGCQSMLCSQCGNHFCWECMTEFKNGQCKCAGYRH